MESHTIRQNVKLDHMDLQGAQGEKYWFADVGLELNSTGRSATASLPQKPLS